MEERVNDPRDPLLKFYSQPTHQRKKNDLHVQPEQGVISRDENRFRCVKMGEIQEGKSKCKIVCGCRCHSDGDHRPMCEHF